MGEERGSSHRDTRGSHWLHTNTPPVEGPARLPIMFCRTALEGLCFLQLLPSCLFPNLAFAQSASAAPHLKPISAAASHPVDCIWPQRTPGSAPFPPSLSIPRMPCYRDRQRVHQNRQTKKFGEHMTVVFSLIHVPVNRCHWILLMAVSITSSQKNLPWASTSQYSSAFSYPSV